MRPSFLHPVLAFLAASSLWGQAGLAGLRGLPSDTLGFVWVADPGQARICFQGLKERLGGSFPEDPVAALLKSNGLATLPDEHHGLLLAALPGEGTNGDPVLVLGIPVGDAKAFTTSIKASPAKDGALFTFKAQGHASALIFKDGWAFLAPAAHGRTLRGLLKTRTSLMPELEPMRGWLAEGDACAGMTAQGLKLGLLLADKAMRDQHAHALSKGLPGSLDAQAFVAQAMRELTHVGIRVQLNHEDGTLKVAARMLLAPGGAWASMGKDLEVPADFGLAGLPKKAFNMALGGSLPTAWMSQALALTGSSRETFLTGAGLNDDQIQRFKAVQATSVAAVKATGLLIPQPEGDVGHPGLPMVRVVSHSAAAYLDLEQQHAQDLDVIMKEAGHPSTFRFERHVFEGMPGGISSINMANLLGSPTPKSPNAGGSQEMKIYTAALDDTTLITGMVSQDALRDALRDYQNPANHLLDDGDLVKTTALLPKDAHFYCFVNPVGMQESQIRAMKKLSRHPEGTEAPAAPEDPPLAAPPLGLSVRFELNAWDFELVFPGELQIAMNTLNARQKAAMDALANRRKNASAPAPASPEGEALDEDELK